MTVVGMSPPFQKGLSTRLLFQDVSFHLIYIYIVWTTKQHFSQHSQSAHLQAKSEVYYHDLSKCHFKKGFALQFLEADKANSIGVFFALQVFICIKDIILSVHA